MSRNKCRYCGATLETHGADFFEKKGIYTERVKNCEVICCSNSGCDSYLIAPLFEINKGIVANRFLRRLRLRTHKVCDILWKSELFTRDNTYREIGKRIDKKGDYSHIRYLDVLDCVNAIMAALELINENFGKYTYTNLDDEEKGILYEIAKNSFCFSDNVFSSDQLKSALSIMFNDDSLEVTVRAVNSKMKTVTLKKGKDMCIYHYDGTTMRECVASLTKELYNEFAHFNGYPKIK